MANSLTDVAHLRRAVPLPVAALLLAVGWAVLHAGRPAGPPWSQPRVEKPERPDRRPPAPGFVLETLDGRELALADLRGRPVVMNFWASWCVPCRAEAPTLAAAARRAGGRVHFLGVNVLDDPADARRFVERYSLPFPSVVDEEGVLLRLYRVVGLPTTVFVDASGRIAGAHPGPFLGPEGARRLEESVARLVEEPGGLTGSPRPR